MSDLLWFGFGWLLPGTLMFWAGAFGAGLEGASFSDDVDLGKVTFTIAFGPLLIVALILARLGTVRRKRKKETPR